MPVPDFKHVIECIEQAGRSILIPGFEKQAAATVKPDGSVITETDIACQMFLQKKLKELAPDIDFLGEEMSQSDQMDCLNSASSFWCVDPLDGTSNFTTPIPLFAISVALIENGSPVLAIIHDPIRLETFTARKGEGCKLNGQPLQSNTIDSLEQAVGFIDFKRLQADTATALVTKKNYRSQRNLGSCALEWAWLAAGRGQFIIHGGEKLWDYAAGLLLAEEAGCVVTDFNQQHPFLFSQLSSSIAASANTGMHTQLLEALSD
ncbi:MAG: inositol monophosphatase [Mariprofundaceae bacterium]